MVLLAYTLRDILGAPEVKTASLEAIEAAIIGVRRAYAAEKAVERVVSDPKKGPSKALVRRDLVKTLKGIKTASQRPEGVPFQPLLKAASGAGQDLRTPFSGGTKFPTDDSKSFAKNTLAKSKSKAEVGPAPLMSTLKPKGPSVQDVTPKVSNSTAGFLPKIGYVMHNDPLIQYLQRQEAEKQAMALENNRNDMPHNKDWPAEVTTQDPSESEFAKDKGPNDLQAYLSSKFDTSKGRRAKYLNKDHKAVTGMVNKVLKK